MSVYTLYIIIAAIKDDTIQNGKESSISLAPCLTSTGSSTFTNDLPIDLSDM